VKFDGRAIDRASDLPRLVGNSKPGARATLTVFRRGAMRDLSVQVAELEAERTARRGPQGQAPQERPSGTVAAQSLGLQVAELTEAQKRELKVKGGVRVEAAVEAAARAGIREGDVIVSVGNTEVSGVREFETAVARLDKSRPVPVLIRRGELATYVLVRPAR